MLQRKSLEFVGRKTVRRRHNNLENQKNVPDHGRDTNCRIIVKEETGCLKSTDAKGVVHYCMGKLAG